MQDKKTQNELAVKNNKKNNNNPGFFARLWGGIVRFFKWIKVKFKEIKSELKKVTWPTFKTVMANTGIVLVIVLIFALFVYGIDVLLSFLMGKLLGG